MAQKGQGLIEYLLIIVLVTILTLGVLVVYSDLKARSGFNHRFENREIVINGSVIPANAEVISHPNGVTPLEYVPSSDSGLVKYPTSWNLTKCIVIQTPTGMKNLHAAAPETVADNIRIQMPLVGARSINICAPNGVTTKIYLWID